MTQAVPPCTSALAGLQSTEPITAAATIAGTAMTPGGAPLLVRRPRRWSPRP